MFVDLSVLLVTSMTCYLIVSSLLYVICVLIDVGTPIQLSANFQSKNFIFIQANWQISGFKHVNIKKNSSLQFSLDVKHQWA